TQIYTLSLHDALPIWLPEPLLEIHVPASQEVGHARERVKPLQRPGKSNGHAVVQDIGACFEGMPALLSGEGADHLPEINVSRSGGEGGGAKAGDTGDVDGRTGGVIHGRVEAAACELCARLVQRRRRDGPQRSGGEGLVAIGEPRAPANGIQTASGAGVYAGDIIEVVAE